MQNFSKYFNLDTIDTNQTLKPIIVITDSDNNVLFTLAQDQDEVFNNNGDSIDIINSISKVSNVKISNDFDSKKLKINRLRCTLYNYYDVNTKLSEYVNTGIINKNLYLFYKSPTTNIINFSDTQGDYDCALIYIGEISRIKFDDAKIDITAEDKTQIKIADKQVPHMSIDKLPLEERERILSSYIDDDATVPMTFGRVDKAPVLPYLENNNDRIMNILLDIQPTAGNYKTAKIPSLLDSQPNNSNNCLYVKKDDDYLIWNHDNYSQALHSQKKSMFKVLKAGIVESEYLIPELQQSEDTLPLWAIQCYLQRQITSVYASDGSILDISSVLLENTDNQEFQNIQSINDNGGFEKKWYSVYDSIYSSSINFDTGYIDYQSTTTPSTGRWIILKLDDGADNQLLNTRIDGVWAGNTIMCSDWKLYYADQENSDADFSIAGNQSTLQTGITNTGFYVTPVVPEIWNNLIDKILSNDSASDEDKYLSILNLLLINNNEQLEIANSSIDDDSIDFQSLINLSIDSTDSYLDAPIHLHRNNNRNGGKKYWGSRGTNNGLNETQETRWSNINGLYYGETGNYDKMLSEQANVFNSIAIFEYFNPTWTASSFLQSLEMNNIGFLQSVLVEDLQEEEIYVSILGRTNDYYKEQLDLNDINLLGEESVDSDGYNYSNVPISNILIGDEVGVIDFNDSAMSYFFISVISNIFGNTWEDSLQSAINYPEPDWGNPNDQVHQYCWDWGSNEDYYHLMENIMELNGFESIFYEKWEAIQIEAFFEQVDDSAFFKSSYFWKNFIWRAINMPLELFKIIDIIHWQDPSKDNIYVLPFDNYLKYIKGGDFLESYLKKIFEYVFQQDINYTESWTLNITYYIPTTGIDLDLTQEIQENAPNWNDYQIDTLDDWINNFYLYCDDLMQSVNQAFINSWNSYNVGGDDFPTTDLDVLAETYGNTLLGISALEGSEILIDSLHLNLFNIYLGFVPSEEPLSSSPIEKPSDIVMNILTNEMEFGKYNPNNDQEAGNILYPDYSFYDIGSIEESRLIHNNWRMGFSLNKKTEGKKVIEEILKESKSYPRFTSDGRFGLMTIKESYVYDDIDTIIDTNDIIKYNFNQTKREDVVTSVKMFYGYDYGLKKYNNYKELKINDILTGYEGYDYYNIDTTDIDTHKDINLKYHTDAATVEDFAKYTLLNNCNVHNEVNLSLPLNYAELEVGDIIHFPLINNTKAFDIDYSVVDYINGQPVYPLWIIMSTDLGVNDIKIKAVQLHYLGIDGNHQFQLPEEESYDIIGNTNQHSAEYTFTNGEQIPNWNFNIYANVDSGVKIPYFDINGDGVINVVDIVAVINHILGTSELSQSQKDRLKYRSDGSIKQDNIINVIDIVSMVNMIL